MSKTNYPPCWTYDPGDRGDDSVGLGAIRPHIWVPAPNGDALVIAELHEPMYRVEPTPGDEFDTGERYLDCEVDAIGKLMAAAPDLLAALEGVVALPGFRFDSVLTRRKREALALARAAIAKAKGVS